MVTKFVCQECGNMDPQKVFEYDGSLGYEALVCEVCGSYCDFNGSYPADDWSRQFIQVNKLSIHEKAI